MRIPRSIALVLTALGLAVLVGRGPSGSPAPAPAAPTSAAGPVVVEHKFGSTEVPGGVQRVATVGRNDQDFALSLGVVLTRLAVVRDGRTLYTTVDSPLSGALSYSGPDALLYALDVLVPQLANAVGGRPVADLSNA